MKDEEFKQKLSEVAEWRIPETITSTKDGKAKKHRRPGRPSAEDLFLEQQEEQFLEQTGGVNETFPPQLMKLKTCATTCEDCGKFCENGRHTEKKMYQTGTKKNWRERCLTCRRSKNPFTGKFDLTYSQAPLVWTEFLKERKGAYKTEKNLRTFTQDPEKNLRRFTQNPDGSITITFFPDSEPKK